jgi:predicted methyltransferase
MEPDADPDPAIFVFDLKMPTKNQLKKKFLVFIS